MRARSCAGVGASLLTVHVLLLGWVSYRSSATWDEPGHLAAGISHWQFGRFDIYNVNPPLTRLVAAAPVLVSRPYTDWTALFTHATRRPEWTIGEAFMRANRPDGARWHFRVARWACIPFSTIGACVCWIWAQKLYGSWSGLMALTVWCFCPNIIAWGATIGPDLPAGATGALAAYSFWRWLEEPRWGRCFVTGLALGVAELTKMTWIVLFVLWPTLWLVLRVLVRHSHHRRVECVQVTLIILVALYVLNMGYAFEGSCGRLGEFKFVSRLFGGEYPASKQPDWGNRFAQTSLASIPIPLPRNYIQGIDRQRFEFERGEWSYVHGTWRYGSWWYYYIYALLLKVPLGTWLMGVLALVLTVARRPLYSTAWRDELVLVAPLIVVFTLVSWETGFGRSVRYVLPCFPFALIWMSKVGRSMDLANRKTVVFAAGALLWSVMSSMSVYPHCVGYFNELTRGPVGGHRFLLHGNVDWGQDLLYLKEWYDAHPDARPFHLACYTSYSPEVLGIEHSPVPVGPRFSGDLRQEFDERIGLKAGWYALSAQMVHGRQAEYAHFRESLRPFATVGYSIYIYHVTMEEANRVRWELGLPAVQEAGSTGVGTCNGNHSTPDAKLKLQIAPAGAR